MFKYSVGKNAWCLENNERKSLTNMYVENCVLILLLHRVPVIENELSPHYRDNTNLSLASWLTCICTETPLIQLIFMILTLLNTSF